jgi:ATP-dependent DNA ligase
MIVRRPSGFIEPCQPSKLARPPSGPLWVHEIKHDGYRLMVRRDGSRVRCFTRNGHDWGDRRMAAIGKWPIRFALINRGPQSSFAAIDSIRDTS